MKQNEIDNRLITKIRIQNFKSIKDTGDIEIFDKLFVFAGQNEAGKSSIVEALQLYESDELNDFKEENLNFEESSNENKIQKISCTYFMTPETLLSLEKWFVSDVGEEFLKIKNMEIKNLKILKKIKNYSLIKVVDFNEIENEKMKWKFNNKTIEILKGIVLIKKYSENEEVFLDIDNDSIEYINEINSLAKIFWENSPTIIFFNEFTKTLPNKIKISDLENENKEVNGYDAVLNLEKQLFDGSTFLEIAEIESNHHRIHKEENNSQKISLKFEGVWTQRIHVDNEIKIKFWIDSEWNNITNSGTRQLEFGIETKNSISLRPEQRSKGFKWFLAFWLEVEARKKEKNLIFVFDEPSAHLHVNGCLDVLAIFKNIVKENQIIYTTHSPYLIEIDNLQRIGLVINDKNSGTKVENLTFSNLENQNQIDALRPVTDAIGMSFSAGISFFNNKNVIVEGISDFFYFKAMALILKIKNDKYALIPMKGIKYCNVIHLINLFIGNNLKWLLIMDNGFHPQEKLIELTNQWGEDIQEKIKLHNFSDIEEVFTVSDLKLINKNNSEKIAVSKKFINAKIFLKKVEDGEITLEKLSKKSINWFKEIFAWIEEKLK